MAETTSDAPMSPLAAETSVGTDSEVPDKPVTSASKSGPPPRTGYMLFMKEKRAELSSEGRLAQKASETAKQIGALWSALSAEEKQAYNDRVTALRQEYELSRDPTDHNTDNSHTVSTNPSLLQFPVGRIKKIVMLDDSVKRISKDATICITRAVEGFVKELAQEMCMNAKRNQRKTVQIKDFNTALYLQRKYRFIHHVFTDNPIDNSKPAKKKRKSNNGNHTRPTRKKKQHSVSVSSTIDSSNMNQDGSSTSEMTSSKMDVAGSEESSNPSITQYFHSSESSNHQSTKKDSEGLDGSEPVHNSGDDDDLFGGGGHSNVNDQSGVNNTNEDSVMLSEGGGEESSSKMNMNKRRKLNNDDSSMMMMDDTSLLDESTLNQTTSVLDTTKDLLMFGEQTEDSSLGLALKNHSVDIEDLA